MKKNILIITTTILIFCCHPPREDYYPNNADVVIINAKLLNPKDTFSLGDTVKFYFEVPDSISFNGKKIKTNAINDDFCSFSLFISLVDSTKFSDYYRVFSPTYIQAASMGYIGSSDQFYLGKENGIFKGYYYLIPKKSGIFVLEENNYALMYTDNGTVRSSVHFDLGSINRHFNYFVDNVKVSRRNDLQQYLANKGNGKAYELYVFYVK